MGAIIINFFCNIYFGPTTLTNYKIVSQIRCELASSLNIEKLEKKII